MKRASWYRQMTAVLIVTLCFALLPVDAHACELLYVGGDMTDDGANMFMRVEEM